MTETRNPNPNRTTTLPTTSEAIASPIRAKATITRPGMPAIIVAAFALSTYHYFYFIFTARTARSPRRSWKLIGWKSLNTTMTLDQAIEEALLMTRDRDGMKIAKRYPAGKRAWAQIVDRTANPLKYLTAPTSLPAGQSVTLISKRLQNKIAHTPAGLKF